MIFNDENSKVKDESLCAEIVVKTLKRNTDEYDYFSIGSYEVEVKNKGKIRFDFDCSLGNILDSKTIEINLNSLSDCYEKQITFDDFKNITNWIEFFYMQDITGGKQEVQELIEVLSFIVFNEEGEEYELPSETLEMINSCIKESTK